MEHVSATAVRDNSEPDRRDRLGAGNRMLGRVVACNGSRAVISAVAKAGDTSLAELWSVGRLISINVGENRVVALVYAMDSGEGVWGETNDNNLRFEVELVGEIRNRADGRPKFSAGISHYPFLGAVAHRIRAGDLRAIYDIEKSDTAVIGRLTQDETMDAVIHIPSLLQRHFAIVGTTGVGKSSAVSLLLHEAIKVDPDLRVMILDPHNEFAAAFPESSIIVDPETLDLPFWLFRLEEFVEVIFRGRPGIPEEIDVLRDLIPEAKRNYRGAADNALFRRATDKSTLTADTPVPYRVADLLALIDERIGRLDGRNEKPHLRQLKARVTAAINDPRFHFMFSSNTINDTLVETIAHLFRLPGKGQPITTFQLAGIPSEVINSVASVLCRMAFEIAMWSNGAVHILVVCEEAHRYVPSDPLLGFVPTRQAIARIAKEGRKYGVSLGVVTQRPGELDPTILSQCSTVFAMRLSNERDQDIIRSAIPDSSVSTTSFLSSIGNGEAIAFGEAIAVPMRMRFTKLPPEQLPKANSGLARHADTADQADLRTIVQGMRALSNLESGLAGGDPQPGDELYTRPTSSHRPADRETPALRNNSPIAGAQPSRLLRRHNDPSAEAGRWPATDRTPAAPAEDRPYRRPAAPSPADEPSIRSLLLRKPIGGERK
ncbi:MAG TPA: DUF87 domain-containing protein [Pararhizobium sp.]|nr:DUF87 domain-containing protein [Pararhizobium sp.]